MNYVQLTNVISPTKQAIGFIHYMPFDTEHGLQKTEAELLEEGVLVENLPTMDQEVGKTSMMYYNPTSKELYVEKTDAPLTKDQEIKLLQQQVDDLNQAMAYMMGGGA